MTPADKYVLLSLIKCYCSGKYFAWGQITRNLVNWTVPNDHRDVRKCLKGLFKTKANTDQSSLVIISIKLVFVLFCFIVLWKVTEKKNEKIICLCISSANGLKYHRGKAGCDDSDITRATAVDTVHTSETGNAHRHLKFFSTCLHQMIRNI